LLAAVPNEAKGLEEPTEEPPTGAEVELVICFIY
jgi:hypothetical protein